MKYTKQLYIAVATILFVFTSYELYLYLNNLKLNQTFETVSETPRPFLDEVVSVNSNDVVYDYSEYTVNSLTQNGNERVILGKFQSTDNTYETIDGVDYSYVLGILDSDNVLNKIWLTYDQYESIRDYVPVGSHSQNKPIVVKVSPHSIIVEDAN